jgi:phosphoglycolate phosphatase-like HAD superfamily hydrolase
MNRIIVFDFDGTLIDVRCRYYKIFYLFLELNSLPKISFEEYIQFRENGQKDDSILEGLTNSSCQIENFKKFKSEHIESIDYLKFDKIRLGALELLNALSESNFTLELLTLRRKIGNLTWQLANLSMLELFSKITHNDGKLLKADYLRNLENISNEVIFIGDSDYDYQAAIDSGTKFYLVSDNNFFSTKNLMKEKRFSFEELMADLCE